jgi:hypothetical protein
MGKQRPIGLKKQKRAVRKAEAVERYAKKYRKLSRKEQKHRNRNVSLDRFNQRVYKSFGNVFGNSIVANDVKERVKKTAMKKREAVTLRSLARQKNLPKGIQKDIAKFL